MLEIGRVNNLTVRRETKSGFYLGFESEYGEVFLPPSMAQKELSVGDEVKAFIYVDTKDQLVATVKRPYAEVGEYALMKVIDNQDFGAFFDWGIEKDLLVPGNEQKEKVQMNQYYIVRVCLETGTDRVFGTTKLGSFIESGECKLEPNQRIKMVVAEETELGFRVIIDKKYIGMIYHSETFQQVIEGTEVSGFVKKIREDGLIDCALQIQGIKNLDQSKIKILEFLIKKGGKSHLHDKSSPEEICELLSMSKKTFKNAIGMLYRDKKILISSSGIELVKNKTTDK